MNRTKMDELCLELDCKNIREIAPIAMQSLSVLSQTISATIDQVSRAAMSNHQFDPNLKMRCFNSPYGCIVSVGALGYMYATAVQCLRSCEHEFKITVS